MMQQISFPPREEWSLLLRRPSADNAAIRESVASILAAVKSGGDNSVREYSARFDGVHIDDSVVPAEDWTVADGIPEELKEAIRTAIKNITGFHEAQREQVAVVETMPGVSCWRKPVPVERVGLYIPGGSAPLFSTLLMLGIPALLAGCSEIVVCTPPDNDGKVHPAILFAAKEIGLRRMFRIGGVQAIAAMAYGTETVPHVSKIFGPGNSYVTAAKMLVQQAGVAIDMPAGPSEVAVLADESCVPPFVAADLLSQAEHGPDSQVLLVSDSFKVISEVHRHLLLQLDALPRKGIAAQALKHSKAILVKDIQEGLDLLNEYAPEHLIIACRDCEELAEKVINAGSVFLGNYSPESAGDYASGTNHTLPTNGYAKAYSGVSLDSFMRKITFQKITQSGLQALAPAIEAMAAAEGLEAHARAVSIRRNSTL